MEEFPNPEKREEEGEDRPMVSDSSVELESETKEQAEMRAYREMAEDPEAYFARRRPEIELERKRREQAKEQAIQDMLNDPEAYFARIHAEARKQVEQDMERQNAELYANIDAEARQRRRERLHRVLGWVGIDRRER